VPTLHAARDGVAKLLGGGGDGGGCGGGGIEAHPSRGCDSTGGTEGGGGGSGGGKACVSAADGSGGGGSGERGGERCPASASASGGAWGMPGSRTCALRQPVRLASGLKPAGGCIAESGAMPSAPHGLGRSELSAQGTAGCHMHGVIVAHKQLVHGRARPCQVKAGQCLVK